MSYCRKCGFELEIGDEFCEKCGNRVNKKENKNEYNIEQVVKNVDLYGEHTGFTKTHITVEKTDKKIVVKVPNGIAVGEQLKLKGLGKRKPDNTYGDLFLTFKNLKYHFNVKDFKKNEVKNLKCPGCGAALKLDDELLDTCKCDYCKSTIFFDGLSNEAYRSKTKIKKMKHEEIMADKYHAYDKEIIDKKYNYKRNDEIRKFKLGVLKWGLIILGVVIVYYLLFIKYFDDEEKKSIKQEEELQMLVEEVMDLVEAKDYEEACLKAKSIIYTENWSSKIEEKWNKKRKETIEYVIKEEKKDKGKSSCKAEKDGLFGLFD